MYSQYQSSIGGASVGLNDNSGLRHFVATTEGQTNFSGISVDSPYKAAYLKFKRLQEIDIGQEQSFCAFKGIKNVNSPNMNHSDNLQLAYVHMQSVSHEGAQSVISSLFTQKDRISDYVTSSYPKLEDLNVTKHSKFSLKADYYKAFYLTKWFT